MRGDRQDGSGSSEPQPAGPVAAGDPPPPVVAKASSGAVPPATPPPGRGVNEAAVRSDAPEEERARSEHALEEVLVLDFGGQYSQLIARRIRECGVFAELLPSTTSVAAIRERAPRGLVLSGGPASVYEEGAPA